MSCLGSGLYAHHTPIVCAYYLDPSFLKHYFIFHTLIPSVIDSLASFFVLLNFYSSLDWILKTSYNFSDGFRKNQQLNDY